MNRLTAAPAAIRGIIIKLPKQLLILGLLFLPLLVSCGKDEERLPPGDEFMILKSRLNLVQTALVARDSASLSDLMVPALKDEPEGVRSLLGFVYGDRADLELSGLVNYKIYYTLDKARIDCDLAWSASDSVRATTLTFELIDTLWLLKRWEPGLSSLSGAAESD